MEFLLLSSLWAILLVECYLKSNLVSVSFPLEQAERLPPDQRKRYAEKVAMSFWRAIGGDEDEIDGLSDSSADL